MAPPLVARSEPHQISLTMETELQSFRASRLWLADCTTSGSDFQLHVVYCCVGTESYEHRSRDQLISQASYFPQGG
jgi:hypothetical protein